MVSSLVQIIMKPFGLSLLILSFSMSCSLNDNDTGSSRKAKLFAKKTLDSEIDLTDAQLSCASYYDALSFSERPDHFELVYSIVTPNSKNGINFIADEVFLESKSGKVFPQKNSQKLTSEDAPGYLISLQYALSQSLSKLKITLGSNQLECEIPIPQATGVLNLNRFQDGFFYYELKNLDDLEGPILINANIFGMSPVFFKSIAFLDSDSLGLLPTSESPTQCLPESSCNFSFNLTGTSSVDKKQVQRFEITYTSGPRTKKTEGSLVITVPDRTD